MVSSGRSRCRTCRIHADVNVDPNKAILPDPGRPIRIDRALTHCRYPVHRFPVMRTALRPGYLNLGTPTMSIDIVKATTEDFAVVKNLVPYYIYDMSEFMGWDCNAEGRWDGCDELPDYWKEPDHHPFLIKVNQSVAGFAMIRRFPDELDRYEVGEFFVARKFKRQRIGKRCAFWLFDAFPGKWIVRVLDANSGARSFWDSVIREYTDGAMIQTSEQYVCHSSGTWQMQFYRFESRRQRSHEA